LLKVLIAISPIIILYSKDACGYAKGKLLKKRRGSKRRTSVLAIKIMGT